MSIFYYIPGTTGTTSPSAYAGESTIKVMNGGGQVIPSEAFKGLITATYAPVSLVFESNSTITTIDATAFQNCPGLTSVTFPTSLTTIGNQSFEASGITTLTFDPSGSGSLLTSIGGYAFFGVPVGMTVNINKATASQLPSPGITLPSQSTNFFGAVNVTTLNYPNTFEFLDGTTSPSDYNGENTILVKNGSSLISSNAFTSKITATYAPVSLIFESNSIITSIGNGAFQDCHGLTIVTLPASITTIDQVAFKNSGIKTLTIEPSGGASSLTSIASDAFSDVPDKMTVNINKATASQLTGFTDFPSQSTFFFGALQVRALNYPNTFTYKLAHTLASTYHGENTILVTNSSNLNNDSIEASAFEGRITAAYAPVSLEFESGSHCKIINDDAFQDCPGLTRVTLPSSLTTIAAQAFSLSALPAAGKGLTFTDLANSTLTSIGNEAFYNQSNLTSITLPKSLQVIGVQGQNSFVFYNCNLTTLTIESGSLLLKDNIANNAFVGNNGMSVNMTKATGGNIGITVPTLPSSSIHFFGATGVITVEYPPVLSEPPFPHPKHEKNKRCLGVNQKLSSGLARLNFKFQTNQFSAGRSRTAQSKQKANGPYTVIFPIR